MEGPDTISLHSLDYSGFKLLYILYWVTITKNIQIVRNQQFKLLFIIQNAPKIKIAQIILHVMMKSVETQVVHLVLQMLTARKTITKAFVLATQGMKAAKLVSKADFNI